MEWLKRFLAGRYFRADELSFALLILMILLGIIGLAVKAPVIYLLSDLLFLIFILRNFSRRIDRRMAENAKFVQIFGPFYHKIGGFFQKLYHRFRDRKTHVYLKCPSCKQTLRLPRGKGKLKVSCPKCKTEFYKTT